MMKYLKDSTRIPDSVWYYLLVWKDNNSNTFRQKYQCDSLSLLNKDEIADLLLHVATTDAEAIKQQLFQ